jgi:zinc protease
MYALGGLRGVDAKTKGFGNFTMQGAWRGTKTGSAQEVAEFFDSIGGSMNTALGQNSWYWTASIMTQDFDRAMAVYAEVVNNPSFPESELTPMRQRILATIEGQEADWNLASMKFFKEKYYGPRNSPYQFLPIGTKENVSAVTREQVQKWYDEKVRASRRVLAIYGDVDLEKAKSLAAKYLGQGKKLASQARQEPAALAQPAAETSQPSISIERVEVNKTEQPVAGIVIGFDADSVIGDPANYAIDVADTMSSGWGYPTGYLHEVLRGRGLVYVVHGQNWPGRAKSLPGTFFVFAGCDPRKVNEVIELIMLNMARLQGSAQDMQEDWFKRSKELITISDAMDNETAAEQATTAALDELYGLGYDYHKEFADKINAVTLDDVRTIAERKFRRAVVTVSTPAPELVKVKPGERTFKEFPPVDLTPRGVQHDTGGGGAK